MIKSLIEVSLKNRSLNHILFIFLLLLAYVSYTKTPKEMFPPSSLDVVTIQGHYKGANSSILDKLIVKDIEKALQNNQYISDITTIVSDGTFHINCDIRDSRYIQESIDDIKNRIENLKQDLPSDMDMPIVKALENYFPLLDISVSSNRNKNYIEIAKELQDEIKELPNLHSVAMDKNYDKLMIISLDEQKLLAYNLSNQKIYSTLSSLYSLHPIGKISTDKQKYYLEAKNSSVDIDEISKLEILADDKVIPLKNIATLRYDYETDNIITRTNAKESAIINIKKAKLGDSIQLSKEIRVLVDKYAKKYADIDFEVLNDSSFWIKNRLNTITSNIFIGLLLLFLSIWLFMSLKIALVVLLGMPVSFAFGFIGLDFFDASLNTLSMIGVLLSLGILADEAIVISENIQRHLAMNKEPQQAYIDATYEMLPVLFASLLTTIIAFLPLTMLSGGLGVFIKIIPLMVIILIVSSFLESFIFLPRHYKDLSFIKDNRDDFRERAWQKISLIYKKSLRFFMKKAYFWGFLLVIFTIVSSLAMAKSSKFQLFPEFDAMSVNITAKVKNSSVLYTSKEAKKLETLLLEEFSSKDIASVATIIGMNSDGRSLHEKGESLFTITLHLKEKMHEDFFNRVINPIFTPYRDDATQRTREVFAKDIKEQITSLVQKHALRDDFLEFNIEIPQTGVVKSDVEISISHRDNAKIRESIDRLKKKMLTINGVEQIKDDMKLDELRVQIDLNSYAQSLGFTQEAVVSKVRAFVSMQKLSKISDTNSDIIEMKVDFLNQDTIQSLYDLSLEVPNTAQRVVLGDIASLEFIKDTTTLKKENFKKIFTLLASFDKKKMNSRKFYQTINPTIQELRLEGVDIIVKGEEKTNNQIKKDIAFSLLMTIFGILIVLIWLFSSLRLSLFALSVLPFSIFGVLLGHKIVGMDISFSSLLGLVGLLGVTINDTLVMLSMIKDTKTIEELIDVASTRLRPIFLTSITTIVGFSTLIFFASAESLLMQPIAVSIGFGLLYTTIINLYYLPIFYGMSKKYKMI